MVGLAIVSSAASACTAIRPLDPWEAGSPGRDAAGSDATLSDASVDAARGDTGDPDAAAVDAARVDAAVPVDGGCGDALVVYYPDEDFDGFGDDGAPIPSCTGPPDGIRTIVRGGDCNDLVPQIHPGGSETCNGEDDDCDGTVDDGVTRCGTGFGCQVRAYLGHSYALCPSTMRRDEAETECESFGYHLVVIDDAAENTFVSDQARMLAILGQYAWIGLHTTPLLVWEDGTSPRFTSWESAEPDGSGPCARIRGSTGAWSDVPCTDRLAFICEAP